MWRFAFMKEIPLSQGFVALVDDEDYEMVVKFNWSIHKCSHCFYGKKNRKRKGDKHTYMHRLILGLTDPKIKVDHKDGNGLNNQRSNLRVCSQTENVRNARSHKKSSSGYKGVCWANDKKKWVCRIYCGRYYHLGYFACPVEAAKTYDAAARIHHGDFAKTNFPA
jgi:hypothetical protein